MRFVRHREEQLKILAACHLDPTAGHMGEKRTVKRITERTSKSELPVKAPWYNIGIDFIGPINPSSSKGNRYILTISDYFSKFVEAVALPTKNADGVANALFKVNSGPA